MVEHGRECHTRVPDLKYFSCISIPRAQAGLCCRRLPVSGGAPVKDGDLPARNRGIGIATGTGAARLEKHSMAELRRMARANARTKPRAFCANGSLLLESALAVSKEREGARDRKLCLSRSEILGLAHPMKEQ